ncbi:MAG: bifunctional diaminohydroxyphosphoribosylaminopyrimidine deaminase/5-amino-6-(5-phosphoribosylamino)uracil reductase RibD [Verrucomicrobiaceae bacterium]|nr:bifunctional diaminohydroxyphosphoribosylaminopyrimidine deaminase/5-amino-6-(5-phosphoribosylamino)uracil reductase RibD [Verrucomicrobiaceae bacterium]
MDSVTPADQEYLREALAEGRKGLGTTSPNPPVGAVIVRDGRILGRGWHQRAGGPHAEIAALADAARQHGPEAARGATLYVTLEPCSTRGRTPACTGAILEAGLARVVVGATDPNPLHAGAGLDLLRDAGVEVTRGVLEKESRELIRFFSRHITTGLPWVLAKSAMTLDGRTTLPAGEGQWISSEEAREDVQFWRRQCDAILVGGETFRRDNPSLTLRGKWAEDRLQPWRVVLSSDPDLPRTHHLFTDAHSHRTLVHEGLTLRESLTRLGAMGVSSVMLESGGRLLTHALAEGLVNEVILYLAPVLGGGDTRLIRGEGIVARLREIETAKVGPDIRIRGKVA